MAAEELLERMQEILRLVLQDDELEITDETTADEVDGWDSLAHINVIVAVEQEFGVKFATAEIASTKAEDQNIGCFLELLTHKLA